MSDPVLHAFFVGRALAEAVNEQAEKLLTDTISLVGKFDAEQRENLRQFTEDVLARARQAEEEAGSVAVSKPAPGVSGFGGAGGSQDLQATIDGLRAEIAQVRVALQQYRATSHPSS
jgi:polyhydroxyalkanoate synthesis regulator phasin